MAEQDSERTPYEIQRKHVRRTYNDSLGIPITIMQFGKLHRHDITVKGMDISEGGVGIISDIRIAPGFVWFWRRVGKQKAGMIMWSRRTNGAYRAGIQFLTLPAAVDESLTFTE